MSDRINSFTVQLMAGKMSPVEWAAAVRPEGSFTSSPVLTNTVPAPQRPEGLHATCHGCDRDEPEDGFHGCEWCDTLVCDDCISVVDGEYMCDDCREGRMVVECQHCERSIQLENAAFYEESTGTAICGYCA